MVSLIPAGKVAGYGQIAAMIGSPRAARQVGRTLASLGAQERDIPWWRVVNAKGYLSINQGEGGSLKELQRQLLLEEEVDVREDFYLDMKRFQWRVDIIA